MGQQECDYILLISCTAISTAVEALDPLRREKIQRIIMQLNEVELLPYVVDGW